MLNITRKGSYQDAQGYVWDYYGDDDNNNVFYIVPRPQFVFDAQNNPIFQVVKYNTDSQQTNGSGYCHIEVELSVPADIEAKIKADIPSRFPDATNPVFNSLDYNPGATATFNFVADGNTLDVAATASQFGSNTASFVLELNKSQLDTLVAAFSKAGGTYQVAYNLSVPARLPAVTATLGFDSAIAYQYQVTHAHHSTWGKSTPRSVKKLLDESESSTVDIKWGIANPPTDLRTAVANWANDTLADLVKAEVDRALQIAGTENYDSFTINSVSSFTSTYKDNEVINWFIQPSTVLPSIASLGKNIDDFIATVNKRQQVISISAFLPFTKDSAKLSNVPKKDEKPVLIESVTVTVKYPGLSQADATHTFTENGTAVFKAPYDEQHGPGYDLEYTANYQGSSTQIHNTITDIDQGDYSLKLESVGILSILFDAHQAFSASVPPDEVDIQFSYVQPEGTVEPITHELIIKKSDKTLSGRITSYSARPISSGYNYQTTYVFNNGEQFVAPLQQNRNGFSQIIPAVNAMHQTQLIVLYSTDKEPPILSTTVQMWYENDPNVPHSSSQPSKASPAVFNLTPKPISAGSPYNSAITRFVGLVNAGQPLFYSAAITSVAGQTTINDQKIEQTQPSLLVSPTQRYFTLEISSGAIDWGKAVFDSVQVIVTAKVDNATPTQAERELTWNKNENGSKFLTYSYQEGQAVSYNWKINYITPGEPVKTLGGMDDTDIILNIPASPGSQATLKTVNPEATRVVELVE